MPASKNKSLSALWLVDPKRAATHCRAALTRAKGDADEAARLLGVSRRTMFRWMKDHPELREAAS